MPEVASDAAVAVAPQQSETVAVAQAPFHTPNGGNAFQPRALASNLSFSQASALADCGERYRLERMYRVPQVPSWALAGGKAAHTGTELLDLARLGGEDALVEHLTLHQSEVQSREKKRSEDPIGFIDRLVNAVMACEMLRWIDDDDLPEGPAPEPEAVAAPEPQQNENADDNTEEVVAEKAKPVRKSRAKTSASTEAKEPVTPKVAPLPEAPSAYAALANILLDAEIRRAAAEGDVNFPDPSTWKASGKKSVAWPNKEDGDWWRAHLPKFLFAWTTWRDRSGFSVAMLDDIAPAIETDVSALFTDIVADDGSEIVVMGYMDRLLLDPAGRPCVVDIKSSAREADDDEQLGLYSVMLEMAGYPRPLIGYYWMTRTGELGSPRDLSHYTYEYFAYRFGVAKRRRAAGEFLANVKSTFCGICGVREFCYARKGKYANLIPRPWQAAPPVFRTPGVDPTAAPIELSTPNN